MKKGILLLFGLSLVISCQLRVDKRLYNRGFYVQTSGKKKSSSVQEENGNAIPNSVVIANALNPEQEQTVVRAETFPGLNTITSQGDANQAHAANEPMAGDIENNNKADSSIRVGAGSDNPLVGEPGAENKQDTNADSELFGLAALLGLGVFALVRINRERVFKATRWANRNKIKSKALIILIQAALCVLGISGGFLFHKAGGNFSDNLEYFFGGAMSLGFLYLVVNGARKRTPVFSSFYLKKASHLVIGLCLLGTSAGIGNRLADHRAQVIPLGHAIEKAQSLLSSAPLEDAVQNAQAPAPKMGSKGLVALYIFLAFLLLLALTILTCAVGCSVGPGAAVIVGILCALFMVLVIMSMVKSVKRRKFEESIPE